MNKKNSLIKRILSALIAALMLLGALPAVLAADASQAVQVAGAAPIEAIAADGRVIRVASYRNTHHLCLPGAVDRSGLSLRYTGEGELYIESTGELLSYGDVVPFDFPAGEMRLYEHRSEPEQYVWYKLNVMYGSPIPALFVELEGGEDVLDFLHEDKEHTAKGTLRMTDGAGTIVYDGALDTFKGRGNSSFGSPGFASDKKSYNIKLRDKCELLPGAGQSRKWSLIHIRVSNDYFYDFTGFGHILGYQTYAAIMGEGYYNTTASFADLYIDGEYRGIYILTERTDEGGAVNITDQGKSVESSSTAQQRVNDRSDETVKSGVNYYQYTADAVATADLDITGGYLLECGGRKDDRCGFETRRGMYFNIKAPEACTKEQVQYIAEYVQDFENALFSDTGYNNDGKHYSEYADLESLAGMVVTYAFFQNWELFRTSTFAYIDTADSAHPTLTFGPVWDFETGAEIHVTDSTLFGAHNTYDTHKQCVWLEQLWQKADFMAIAEEKAQALADVIAATLGEGAEGVRALADIAGEASASLDMNWARWAYEFTLDRMQGYSDHDNSFDYYRAEYITALTARLERWRELWGDGYITTVDVSVTRAGDEYTLTARAEGAAGYQWYVMTDDTHSERIDGATEAEYVTAEPGRYFCAVSGENNAYYKGAKGSVFSKREISVKSAAVSTDSATHTGGVPVTVIILATVVLAAGLAAVIILKHKKKQG